MSDEKTVDNASAFTGYMQLVKECGDGSLPTQVAKEKIEYVSNLDHFVFCAKNYKEQTTCDVTLRKHCGDVWDVLKNEPNKMIELVNVRVRNLLHPAPSATSYMCSKICYLYIMKLCQD